MIAVNADFFLFEQTADGFLEVTLADAKHAADRFWRAFVAECQGTVVVQQLL